MTIQQKQGVNSFWSSKTTHRCVIRCPHKVSYLVCVSGSFFSQKRTSTTSWWTNRKQLTRKLKNSRYNYTLKYTINMHIHVLPAVRVQVCQWCDCVVIIIIIFFYSRRRCTLNVAWKKQKTTSERCWCPGELSDHSSIINNAFIHMISNARVHSSVICYQKHMYLCQ